MPPAHIVAACLRAAAQVVLHPDWGTSVYPASLFTRAPLDALAAAVQLVEEELRGSS